MATNPNMVGDGTSLYISSLLKGTGVKITRLARGLATRHNSRIRQFPHAFRCYHRPPAAGVTFEYSYGYYHVLHTHQGGNEIKS